MKSVFSSKLLLFSALTGNHRSSEKTTFGKQVCIFVKNNCRSAL